MCCVHSRYDQRTTLWVVLGQVTHLEGDRGCHAAAISFECTYEVKLTC
jgi:hypothetical protein